MKLRFRVKHRGTDANRAGVCTTTLICVPLDNDPTLPDDANARAWGGRLPHGELRLAFLSPAAAEQFPPGSEVTIAIRLRGPHDDTNRVQEQPHEHRDSTYP